MYAGADHRAPLAHRFQRGGNQRSDRGEKDSGVERFGRGLIRPAGPIRAKRHCEVLRGRVAWTRKGKDALAEMAGNLGHDVGGGAEAVDADGPGISRHPVGAVSDQPGAEQRGGMHIVEGGRQREAVPRVGDRVVGIAAVDLIAGEARRVAKVFLSRYAVPALPAGVAEPRHADAVSQRQARDAIAQHRDRTDDLVAGHDRIVNVGQLVVDDMQIGAADAAGTDLDQHLSRPWRRHRPLAHCQPRSGRFQNHGPHHVRHCQCLLREPAA